jgi:hypothetical protein
VRPSSRTVCGRVKVAQVGAGQGQILGVVHVAELDQHFLCFNGPLHHQDPHVQVLPPVIGRILPGKGLDARRRMISGDHVDLDVRSLGSRWHFVPAVVEHQFAVVSRGLFARGQKAHANQTVRGTVALNHVVLQVLAMVLVESAGGEGIIGMAHGIHGHGGDACRVLVSPGDEGGNLRCDLTSTRYNGVCCSSECGGMM